MALKLITAPTAEPVSLVDAKNYIRVDETADDTDIQGFIKAAREYIESFTRRTLPITEWELVLNSFPDEITVPLPPLVSVTSISYKDKEGNTTTLSATDYVVDTYSEPGKIKPVNQWPSFDPYPVNAVSVQFKAGYSDVPQSFISAMKLLISHQYENREVVSADNKSLVPMTVETLVYPYRIGWF